MARLLRFIPDNATLVEVTTRTIQSRLLLTLTPQLNRIILGALARASRRYEVGVVAFHFSPTTSTYWSASRTSSNSRASWASSTPSLPEVVRLTGWKDKVWSRRCQATVVSSEDAAQTARLSYVLSNGVKEHLVARVREWPGVHAAPAFLAGTALEEVWVNRTAEYLAKQRGETTGPQSFEEPEPLPCWEHLSSEQYRHQIQFMVQRSKTRPKLSGIGVANNRSDRMRSGCRIRGQSQIGRRSLQPHVSTLSAKQHAKSSTGSTSNSSPRSGRRPIG